LDLLVVSVSICICSLFGLPWLVAATVLTVIQKINPKLTKKIFLISKLSKVTHINSLKVMSDKTAPGEPVVFTGIK
jgi:hypothetical protein